MKIFLLARKANTKKNMLVRDQKLKSILDSLRIANKLFKLLARRTIT